MKKINNIISPVIFPTLLMTSPVCLLANPDQTNAGYINDTSTEIETMVVTASTREDELKTAPASMSVISSEELNLRDADELTDALSSEPGITISSVGQTRRGISIRGMPVEHTLFLLDGQRISSSNGVIAHSDFELSWLPNSAIERIEVVRGPMSALYGSDALGGVVNVITKVPTENFAGAVSASWRAIQGEGSDGRRLKTDLYMGGPVWQDKLAFTFAGQLFDQNELPLQEDELQSELESHDAWSGRGAIIWTPTEGQRLDLAFSRSQDDRSRNVASRRGYYWSGDDIDRRHYSLNYRGQWDWGDSRLNIYQSSVERINTRSANSTPTRTQEVRDRVMDGHIGIPVGDRHFVTLGGQVREETLYDEAAAGSDDSISADHRSLFIQDEFEILDNLQLVAGMRLDHHEEFGNETSPRLYAVYEATPNLVVKGGYGQGFRSPTLTELSPDFAVLAAGGRFWVYGNPNLEPELSETYEIGFDYSRADWSVSANLFHNDLENLVQTQCHSSCGIRGSEIRYYENVDDARIQGLELSLMRKLTDSIRLNANYTYLDTENRETDEELEDRPQHSGNLMLSWQFKPNSTLRWRSEFIGEQYAGDGEDTPAYHLHHIDLKYAVTKKISMNAGIENLFDERLQEKSDLFSLAEPGLAFRMGVTVEF